MVHRLCHHPPRHHSGVPAKSAEKEIESPASSARTFIPTHARSRSGASDTLSSAAAVNGNSGNKGTGSATLPDFAGMMVRLNNAAKDNVTPATVSTSKGKAKDEEMGVGGSGGLGRHNTITQRSVGTVLPTSTSIPPANANMRAKAGTFASPHSPSARVSSPTAPTVARPRQVPGTTKIGPSTSPRAIVPPRSQFALARTLVPPRPVLR